MSKYISENLTKDDIIDALKIIFSKDETAEIKEKKSLLTRLADLKNSSINTHPWILIAKTENLF